MGRITIALALAVVSASVYGEHAPIGPVRAASYGVPAENRFVTYLRSVGANDLADRLAKEKYLPSDPELGLAALSRADRASLAAKVPQLKKPEAPPPAKDTRTDKEATWMVTSISPFDGDGDFVAKKGQGIVRVPLDAHGKEIVPPFHLVLRWDAKKECYLVQLTDALGKLKPYEGPVIPGNLLGEPTQAAFSLTAESPERAALGSEARRSNLEIHVGGYRLRLPPATGPDGKLVPIYEYSESRAGQPRALPIAPANEAVTIPLVEEELGIGSAAKTAPRPLDHAWSDGGIKEFIAVDESQDLIYVQRRNGGKLALERYRIVDPAAMGYPRAEIDGRHVVLGRRKTSPTGINDRIPGEEIVQKGWFVRNDDGEIVRIDETRASPTYQFKPVFGGAR